MLKTRATKQPNSRYISAFKPHYPDYDPFDKKYKPMKGTPAPQDTNPAADGEMSKKEEK